VLLGAFPPGTAADPELALARATSDLVRGRLDEAAAHLAVAATHAETMPPDRRRRLEVAITSLQLGLARRRGHLVGVLEQAEFLNSPVSGPSGEDIALDSDLRAVALMNLGTVEAWSPGLPDAERHLQEGAALARLIGRPYLEVSCLSELGFSSRIHPFTVAQERCREATAAAERHGWGTEPVIVPALLALAASMIFTGDLDEGERWLRRAGPALEADAGPGIRLLAHIVSGMLQVGRGHLREAAWEFGAAESLGSRLTGSHAQANQVTGWLLTTLVRLGMTGEARAALAAVADERAGAGEIRNARAVICLADGDPAGTLGALRDVLDGTAPVIGCVTVVEAQLLAGLAYRALGDRRAADQSAERALALAEADRLMLPFAMTGSRALLEALPRHQTAHVALLADILDLLPGGFGGGGQPLQAGGSPGGRPPGGSRATQPQ
jgi:LuxR family transcriptional regulator, maltose regulon positive regulatory protein